MTRGLPVSILIHALTIGLVLVFGNTVNQKQFEVPRTIGVRLVELPKVQQPKTEPLDPVKIVEPPKPKPKVQEELPPKEVPEEKPEPKVEKKPDPPREIIPEEPTAEPLDELSQDLPSDSETPAAAAVALPTGASVAGLDSNFPFAWYLSVMEGQVARNWNPRQMGYNNSGVSCVLHFTIQRSGAVSQVTITRSSGIGVFDREAWRAVQSTRLPQLPGDFGASTLGVTMTFNLESANR